MVDTDFARARQSSVNTPASSVTGEVPGLLGTGDRVQTPQGAGVVVYRRMKPPHFMTAEAYSVRLDGLDHLGAMFAAGDVSAEGAQP